MEALKREFKEEINSELNNIKFRGILENIFTFEGNRGHEMVMMYEADLADESLYGEKNIRILDNDGACAIWEDLGVLQEGYFYPDGIKKFI